MISPVSSTGPPPFIAKLRADALGHVPTVLASFLADTSGGRGVRGEVLFPPGDWAVGVRPQNNDSLVLRPTYGESSVLLEGDAENTGGTPHCRITSPHRNRLKGGASQRRERNYR